MYKYRDIISNRHMFFRDRFYDYKKLCERIATTKSKCQVVPPQKFEFLDKRNYKKQLEKEMQNKIEYSNYLLSKKYKDMYTKNNKYHPNNIKLFQKLPSLRFSQSSQKYQELKFQNNYLGRKLNEISQKPSEYNFEKLNKQFLYQKKFSDRLKSSSIYKNMFLDLVSPSTYEKRLYQISKGKFNLNSLYKIRQKSFNGQNNNKYNTIGNYNNKNHKNRPNSTIIAIERERNFETDPNMNKCHENIQKTNNNQDTYFTEENN